MLRKIQQKNKIAKYLNLLIDVGDFIKAKVAFEKLVSAPKNDVDTINAIARYYVANEQVDKALELFEGVREKYQKNLVMILKS